MEVEEQILELSNDEKGKGELVRMLGWFQCIHRGECGCSRLSAESVSACKLNDKGC